MKKISSKVKVLFLRLICCVPKEATKPSFFDRFTLFLSTLRGKLKEEKIIEKMTQKLYSLS